MRETWYKLEDGSVVDPNEVAPDKRGRLRHKDGRAVAMRGQVPSTYSVDPGEERARVKPKPKEAKPEEPPRGYKTRESKAGA